MNLLTRSQNFTSMTLVLVLAESGTVENQDGWLKNS